MCHVEVSINDGGTWLGGVVSVFYTLGLLNYYTVQSLHMEYFRNSKLGFSCISTSYFI
jgi:hypothetical protein